MRGGKAADGTPPEHKKNGVIIWSEMQKICCKIRESISGYVFDLHYILKTRHEAEDVVSETSAGCLEGEV